MTTSSPTAEASTTYNLLDEPWLSVAYTDGSTGAVSLIQTFQQADEISGFITDLPVQEFALVRLMLAAMYGAIPGGPTDQQWAHMWAHGIPHQVTDRLRQFHDRFDLLDAEQPFFQVADLRTGKGQVSGLEKLILDVPNGEPFFTTRIGAGLESVDFAEAARWLVTVQAYDPSGIKSGAVGDERVTGGKGYPIGVAWSGHLGGLLVQGHTLQQTLLLNFIGHHTNDALAWNDAEAADLPAWERPQSTAAATSGLDQPAEAVGTTTYFHGPATLYTWQSRRIRLFHNHQRVTGVIIANGDRLKPQNADQHEPMTAWRRSPAQEKALKTSSPVYMPLQHQPGRSIWRGIAQFLPNADPRESTERKPSLIAGWLNHLRHAELLPTRQLTRLRAFGIVYGSNSSVVDESITDDLDIQLSVLSSSNQALKGLLKTATGIADDLAQHLANFAGNVAAAAGRVTDGPRQRARERAYEVFDPLFRDWIRDLTAESDRNEVLVRWRDAASRATLQLGRALVDQAPLAAWVGRTLTDRKGNEYRLDAAQADLWFCAAVKKTAGDAPPETATTTAATSPHDTHTEELA